MLGVGNKECKEEDGMVKLTTNGMNEKLRHMKIKYPFHFNESRRVGVTMTTKKFQIQFAEMPTAVPFARTCRGRISGT
jgi:hypothetical protein